MKATAVAIWCGTFSKILDIENVINAMKARAPTGIARGNQKRSLASEFMTS